MSRRSVFVFSLFLFAYAPASAQTPKTNATATDSSVKKSVKDVEAERILKERRSIAQSLLINL
jgi:hypothetical protein